MSNEQENKQDKVQVHVPQELEYCYRDVSNIYVGMGDVVLEFGNHHRSMPGNVSIGNRIVMTYANAYDLQQRLQHSLAEAQQKMREQMKPTT